MVNIQNIFLGIISHHTLLKETSIIIEDILILAPRFTSRESMEHQGKNRLLKHFEFS